MQLSPAGLSLWAKSATDQHQGHPVIAHLLDVAAAAWAVLELEPPSTKQLYAEDFGLPVDEAVPLLLAVIALHDIGKVSPAFQQLWQPGRDNLVRVEPAFDWRVRGKPPAYPKYVSHALISQVALPNLLAERGFARGLVNGVGNKGGVADAVGCHHGFRANASVLNSAKYPHEQGQGIWQDARKELVAAVFDTIGVTAKPAVEHLSPAAFMRLAGLTSFADWIGSSFYPDLTFGSFTSNLVGYWESSKTLAQARLQQLGWTKRQTLVSVNKSGSGSSQTVKLSHGSQDSTLLPLQQQESEKER